MRLAVVLFAALFGASLASAETPLETDQKALFEMSLKDPAIQGAIGSLELRLKSFANNRGHISCTSKYKGISADDIPELPVDSDDIIAIELIQECTLKFEDGTSVSSIATSTIVGEEATLDASAIIRTVYTRSFDD